MFHHERNAALDHQADLELASATTHPTERNVGKAMLPFVIFLMILSPVLIPAAVTVLNVMRGNHRPAATAGYPRSLASRRFAVPAAA
jgi:hypothetical protein